MKLDEEYECGHIPNETLTVKKMYNDRLGVVQTDSGSRILAKHMEFEEPHLCLAHVAKAHTELKKKESKLKW